MNKRLQKIFCLKSRVVFFVGISVTLISITSLFGESQGNGIDWTKSEKFYSAHIQAEILYLQGVFLPDEAENSILPFMLNHQALFKNKTVLDIGTGSGIISLYAAKLGARKIVATDINKDAIASTQKNSQRLNFFSVIEARYVPPEDIAAYAVIKPNETFDVIISNPPYSLDLDTPENNSITDKGDLGFSIIRGLEKHLRPNGVVILLYRSFFYHQVMVKFARYSGYEVQNYTPLFLTPWEADTLFNYYLARLLKYQNIFPDAFRFNWNEDKNENLRLMEAYPEKNSSSGQYRGFIIIRKK